MADNQAGLKNGKTFPKDDSDLRQDYRDPSPGEPSFPAAINPYDFYNPFLFPYFNPWGIAAVRNYQGLPFGQLPANAADIRNAHKISSSGLPWNVQSRYNNQGAEQQLPHQPIETGSQAGHDTYPPLPQANNSNSTSPSVDLAEHNNNHQSNQQPNTAAPSNTEPNNPHEATTPSYSCQTTTDRPLDPYQHSGAQDHEQTHYSPNDDAPAYDHESNYHHQDSGSDTYAENDDPRPEQEYSHHQEEPEANYESNEENQYEPHNDDSYNRRPPQPYNQQPRPEAMIQRPYHNQMRPQYPMRGPNTYGYPQQGYRPSGYYGFMYHPKYGGVAGIAIIISVVLLIGFLILASASLSSGRSIRTSLPNHNILKYSTYSNTTGAFKFI